MPRSGQTRRQAMRAMRQEDMRERIRESNLLTDVLDTIDKIDNLGGEVTGSSIDAETGNEIKGNIAETHAKVSAYSKANEQRIKLLNKVLPDLRAIDLDVKGDLKVVAIDRIGMEDDEGEED